MAEGRGQYRLVEPVGQGATSQVWRAEDSSSGRLVALKIGKSERHAVLLADEATRLLFVDSYALTRVLDAGRLSAKESRAVVEAGAPFVALEWVPGEVLSPARRGTTSVDNPTSLCLLVARDVGEALSDLHHAGSAHGDVKPANVVQCSDRSGVRLIDLGLGDAVEQPMPRGGTPRYLSPEVLAGGARTDGRARDLWALGLMLAELARPEVAQSDRPVELARRLDWPEPLRDLITALLSPAPAARASAAWVRRRALALLGEAEPAERVRERRRRAIRRAYIALRRAAVLAAARAAEVELEVAGAPAEWLAEAVGVARRVSELRGEKIQGHSTLCDLGAFGQSRWLMAVAGRNAINWRIPSTTDGELAERLLSLAEEREPEGFTWEALQRGHDREAVFPSDPVALAFLLGAGQLEPGLLERAERVAANGGSASLGLAVGRALRLTGELGRALVALQKVDTPQAAVEAAETARRARDEALVERWLERALAAPGCDPLVTARCAAIRARICLDRGDLAGARSLLEGAPPSAFVLETRALVELAQGDSAAAEQTVSQARAVAAGDEEQARAAAVAASLAHAKGDAERALGAFRSAAESAARAGAVLEEATYSTGSAAAAAMVGYLGEALESATRATLLFEWLGRPAEAARAALSRASVYAQAGAEREAREAAEEAIARARLLGDRRCQAYAHWAIADLAEAPERDALEHAVRAMSLLEDAELDDRLRAQARLLRLGGTVDSERADQESRTERIAVDARLEWWGARASALLRRPEPEGAETVLSELGSLVSSQAPLGVRGPALSAAAELSVRIGDGARARRFAQAASSVARELLERSSPELRLSLSARHWITALQSPREAELAPEQLADVDTLVRALGQRDRLRPLLDQVLDALVLWTGVERGVLLLRAPGGRLVARAARNLRRSDLVGPQRELSHTLAERALELCEPVVAVDAMGELSALHESVHALKLRSVLAVPLLARGEPLGVVYLDDRVRRGAFGTRELGWVKLVATVASVAIADARDQILLRRAVRRAERAERRLGAELARREAELDVAARELARARSGRQTRFSYDTLIGQSEPMNRMFKLVDRVTVADVPVLVIGESGSGKELVARAIHDHGARSRRAFVTENCAAIPEGLLESELFGHVRGAFTGASRPRAGLFDVADGGTLFLDEIGEMSLPMQTKLLRVLEGGEVKPVGSERTHRVNVRVITATHRNLEAMVEAQTFRQDLYYRLNVISIGVPALRERPGDIELLVRHFLSKHAPDRLVRIGKPALAALTGYGWPGNVRQLENEIRRALVLADEAIEVVHLSPEIRASGRAEPGHASSMNVRQRVDTLETELLTRALDQTGGNQARAAELLGLSRFGLQKMMKRLGIATGTRVLPVVAGRVRIVS